MAERLQAIFAGTDFRLDPNKAEERVRYYSELLRTQKLSLEQDTTVREQLARKMLYVGDSDGSVRQLVDVRRRWAAAEKPMSSELRQETERWLAMAYLRIGEQENCAQSHGLHTCLSVAEGCDSSDAAGGRRRGAGVIRVAGEGWRG